ncbi:MAG: ATP-binding cassette domain-containing protein [Oscillospiraceae bacterium]|nr:ATP-binding cassette domain-containing protein [Oscillospiraceae bacterium]
MVQKHFVRLPESLLLELESRGYDPEGFTFSVKADLNAENLYADTYLLLSPESLLVVHGMEEIVQTNNNRRRNRRYRFRVATLEEIPLSEIDSFRIDRQISTARYVLTHKDGSKSILCQFSIGFADTFAKFSDCVKHTQKKERVPIEKFGDLEYYCPKCGYRYPEKERKICPNCRDKASIFKRLLAMYRNYFGWTIAIFFCLVATATLAIVSPLISSKMLYDQVLAIGGEYYGQVLFVVLLIVVVRILELLTNAVFSIIVSKITPEITHDLRMNIFSSLQRLSIHFFTSKQTGSLMSRVLNDSDNIYWFFVDVIPYTVTNAVKIIGLAAIMFWLNPYLAAIALVAICLTEFLSERFNKKRRKLHRKRYRAVRSTYSIVSDTLNGQRVVKAFSREENEIARYEEQNDKLHDVSYEISYKIQSTFPTIGLISRITSVLIFGLGAWFIINGQFTLGALTTIASYFSMLEDPINFFMWLGERWARCVDAASRMFEIVDSVPTVQEAENPISLSEIKGDVAFSHVNFEYAAARPILTDLNFRVPAGKMLGIVGKTGAGKTTIINLIARLYDAKNGSVTLDGYDVKDLSFETLRKNIAIVSQETYLFMGSVADNIRYANPNASFEEVIAAAKAASAHDFIIKLPDGYDTRIGVGGYDFSGGERQRISIARAILQSPSILILDEATASMDTRTERKIQAAIDKLKEGRTIISIAHRLSTLRDADNLIVIEKGKIVEEGTHEELIHKKGAYYELHKLQSQALQFIESE